MCLPDATTNQYFVDRMKHYEEEIAGLRRMLAESNESTAVVNEEVKRL